MINLNDARAKRSAWIVFDRMLKRFEPFIYRRSRAYVYRQYERASKVVEIGLPDNYLDITIDKEYNYFKNLLVTFYRRVVTAFATMLMNQAKDDLGTRSIFWDHVNRWINDNVGKKVTRVNNTTKDRIKRIIRVGIEEGLSNKEIAYRLTLIGKIDSIKRANRIARTETHQTANKGTFEMAKELNMQVKEWLAARDERTRLPHRHASGQVVGIDDSFVVGGENLMFPGDPDGSAENVINCRCTHVFRSKKKGE